MFLVLEAARARGAFEVVDVKDKASPTLEILLRAYCRETWNVEVSFHAKLQWNLRVS
jgi:hypothetical protein